MQWWYFLLTTVLGGIIGWNFWYWVQPHVTQT